MNIYTKHKEVIEHFYKNNGKKDCILVKVSNTWQFKNNSTFKLNDEYIINDEYVHLRKAIYEGKSIFYYDDIDYNKWIKLDDNQFEWNNPNREFSRPVTDYKIAETKEPAKFKIGDWVKIELKDTITNKIFTYIAKIAGINDDKYYVIIPNNNSLQIEKNAIKHWIPKYNELIWVSNNSYSKAKVGKFKNKKGNKYFINNDINAYELVEPVIGGHILDLQII